MTGTPQINCANCYSRRSIRDDIINIFIRSESGLISVLKLECDWVSADSK